MPACGGRIASALGTKRKPQDAATRRRSGTDGRDGKFRERWRAAGEIAAVENPCKPKTNNFGKILKKNLRLR
jgi:hypothetical protein